MSATVILKDKNPKVEIGQFIIGIGGYSYNGKHWDMDTLLSAAKGLPVYDLQLSALNLSNNPWGEFIPIMDLLYHMKRIKEADLSYPIIQTPDGIICDGWHRVCKAILQGETTIKAVRLRVMPNPDRVNKE